MTPDEPADTSPEIPLTAQVIPPNRPPQPPLHVVLHQEGVFGRFGRWLPWALLGMAVLTIITLSAVKGQYMNLDRTINEKLYSHDVNAKDKIAIIKVSGVIMTGEGFVKRQIDRVLEDDDVKAIVLRVESPGGTIVGSHRIYHQLCKLTEKKKIPMVVSMGSMAASGGYYVAMAVGAQKEFNINGAEDVVFAEEITTTGSIGVILPHYNIAGLMKDWKIEDDSIKSHPLKDMGTISRKMTAEERAKFQAYINDSFERFKKVIRYGRPFFEANPKKLDALATGEIFTADQAVANGLVDQQGYLEDAVDRAIELAKLDKQDVRVIEYELPPTLVNELLGAHAKESRLSAKRLSLETLFEMSTPRAYYIYSWMPSLAAGMTEQ